MSLINPYLLLGVTINTTKDELKKRYYDLAILMHPDKGGDKDDMITLQMAYKFILRELETINNSESLDKLSENAQQEYKKFCKSQENTLPIFNDIFAEAFNLDKFNDYFSNVLNANAPSAPNEFEPIHVSMAEGYGDLMEFERSDKRSDERSDEPCEPYTPDYEKLKPINHFTLAEYTPIIKEQTVCDNLFDYQNPTTNNFTTTMNGMVLSDYKDAFSAPHPVPHDPEYKNAYHASNIDSLMMERDLELQNTNTSTITSPIWSYEGLIDSSRKLIKNLFLKN